MKEDGREHELYLKEHWRLNEGQSTADENTVTQSSKNGF